MFAKHPVFNAIYRAIYRPPKPQERELEGPPVVAVSQLGNAPVRYAYHDGEKFPGGFGFTNLLLTDYWTLRARSAQLFKTNIYARGIVRCLVTNIINVGLHLEAVPDESILGLSEDELADWSEQIENRFDLWSRSPSVCDYQGQQSFGALQIAAKTEAFIAGDVLVVLHQNKATGLPQVRLVGGSAVQTPLGRVDLLKGHKIVHGVELDPSGRHVGYWIRKDNDKFERLPAWGPSGRRIAWLVYGTDKRLDDVRGEPLLSIVLQSLNEIDRYRDSVQRKATINAIFAMVVERENDGPPSRALTAGGGAQLRTSIVGSNGGEGSKSFNFVDQVPGGVIDRLAPGEKVKGFPPTGTDEKFSEFEAAIVYAIAWCLRVPPESLTLTFQNNYSASQAATNEFKNFLNPVRMLWGEEFCQPIYTEWLLSEVLMQRVDAPGLLESWRDPRRFDEFAAWVSADWCGAIKPSIDLVKQGRGYQILVNNGFMSRDRASRETTGTKYSKNIKKLKRENEMLVDAMRPLQELKDLQKTPGSESDGSQTESGIRLVYERMDDFEDRLETFEEGAAQ